MKEVREGIKQDISKVLDELKFNRCDDCSHPYKSLTDSLVKLIDIELEVRLDSTQREFYNGLLLDLEKEAKETRKLANSTLENKDYKGYRNWLESLKRILSVHQYIEYKLNSYPKI